MGSTPSLSEQLEFSSVLRKHARADELGSGEDAAQVAPTIARPIDCWAGIVAQQHVFAAIAVQIEHACNRPAGCDGGKVLPAIAALRCIPEQGDAIAVHEHEVVGQATGNVAKANDLPARSQRQQIPPAALSQRNHGAIVVLKDDFGLAGAIDIGHALHRPARCQRQQLFQAAAGRIEHAQRAVWPLQQDVCGPIAAQIAKTHNVKAGARRQHGKAIAALPHIPADQPAIGLAEQEISAVSLRSESLNTAIPQAPRGRARNKGLLIVCLAKSIVSGLKVAKGKLRDNVIMAAVVVNSLVPFNINNVNLYFYSQYGYQSDTVKNANIRISNITYSDNAYVLANDGLSNFQLDFFGFGIVGTPSTAIVAGTIQAVGEYDIRSSSVLWFASGMSISAASLYAAAMTPSNADELALISGALSGDDAITLSNLADVMSGFAGNDRIFGGGGNDTLFGGTGIDASFYSGERRNYQINRTGDAVTVRDLRANGDGTDTINGFERLEFADGSMSIVPEELMLYLPGSRDLFRWNTSQGANGFNYLLKLGAGTGIAAAADFTGDGRSDVVFRQADGGLIRWDLTLGGNGFSDLPRLPGFEVIGKGDLIGNSANDLLLKNAAGQLTMLDTTSGTYTSLLQLASGWSVAGVANINGTGKSDVVFQNVNGTVIALTEGGWTNLLTLSSGWEIVSFGDVVGGLADDFIFQNTNGVALFWDATRGGNGWQDFVSVAPGWSVEGIFDLNGDGRDDVLIRNDNSGAAIYWKGDGWGDLGGVLANLVLIGTGVFP